jgi:DnaJ-class molecular chaperone
MLLQEALEILGLENDVYKINIEYLKKVYHKLALKNHPDKNGNTIESKEIFQKITEAYEVLKREISIINDIDYNT